MCGEDQVRQRPHAVLRRQRIRVVNIKRRAANPAFGQALRRVFINEAGREPG
jgi:hypothetical protein